MTAPSQEPNATIFVAKKTPADFSKEGFFNCALISRAF